MVLMADFRAIWDVLNCELVHVALCCRGHGGDTGRLEPTAGLGSVTGEPVPSEPASLHLVSVTWGHAP